MNILRNRSPPLQINRSSSHGNQSANHPHNQRQANTPGQRQNGTRGSEDTGSNHPIKDQKRGTDHTDLATVFGGCFKDITLICIPIPISTHRLEPTTRFAGKIGIYQKHTKLGDTISPARCFVHGLCIWDNALLDTGFGNGVAHVWYSSLLLLLLLLHSFFSFDSTTTGTI